MKKYIMPIISGIAFVLLLVLDLVTKAVFEGKFITLIKGVFSISSTHNTGAGFSIFSNQTVFLLVITGIFLVLFSLFLFFDKDKKTKLWWICVALIYSGAIGNMIDRIMFGYVRDFLYFELINFPIFNIADICLTVGITLFAINFLFLQPKINKGEQNAK